MPGLSNLQKSSLAQLAGKTYAALEKMDLIDRPAGMSRSAHMAEWRHAEQKEACGISSLTQASNKHYLAIRAHFLQLLGDDAAAFEAQLKLGKARGSSAPGDTTESRKAARHLIVSALTDHGVRARHPQWQKVIEDKGGVITGPYVESIARAQFKTDRLDNLTTRQLTNLLYTVTNRIAAREGRGYSKARNKSQRKNP